MWLDFDLRLVTMLLSLLILVFGGCQQAEQMGEPERDLTLEKEVFPIGGDFTLTDQHGQPFRLADLKRPVLLFFGYATCPDYCPQTLARLAQVYAVLGADAQDVLTVFVSVDSERDTPEVLKTYLSHFDMDVVGLTGKKDVVDAVVKQYAGFYEVRDEGSAAGYLIDHSLYIYVVDREGGVRFLLRSTDSVADIVTVVRQL
ncbi:MAG: SCO family protein [Candidatus Latescibacteria bacterium]|nr:SCO family protein [Candidatus Latescibacterota bacterium]MBT4139912.1 SCO family protein [Candidatus Latescibacterota bacterium]MBT5833101.1 SCO family protein [Candidatus Latescibacterota bacterium]